MVTGCTGSWSSVVLPKLTAKDSYIFLSKDEASWLVTCPVIGLLSTTVFVAALSSFLGRKWLVFSGSTIIVICWVIISAAESLPVLFTGRTILGLGVGVVMVCGSMYTAEVSEDRIRGLLSTVFQAALNAGSLFIFCAGPYMSVQAMAAAIAVIGAIFLVLFVWMPESPYFLMYTGKTELAENSLMKLRGTMERQKVAEELRKVAETVEENKKNAGTILEIFKYRGNVKAFSLCLILMSVQAFSGIMAVGAYATQIFITSGSYMDANMSAMILSSVQLAVSIPTSLLADRAGRRPLLMLSCTGCSIGMLLIGIYFYLKGMSQNDVASLGWLPLTALVIYYVFYAMGLGSVPWAVIAELLPLRIKAPATSGIYFIYCLMEFACVKIFQDFSETGVHLVFWIYSLVCFTGFIFVLLFLPETKNKSFQQIDREVARPKFSVDEVA